MTTNVLSQKDLFDFFHQEVERARRLQAPGLSDDSALYLTSLLAARARTDQPTEPEDTLAELHGRAALAPPAEQARTYRELGDRALHQLGWFEDALQRRQVGPAYYQDMGSAAYARAGEVFKRWYADAFGPVFRELARHFGACVRLCRAVRDRAAATTAIDRGLLQRLDDPEVLADLRRRGWLLTPPGAAGTGEA